MLQLAESILKDYHLAEDAVQETILKLLDNLHMIDSFESDRTKNLVFTFTKNMAINERKKQKRRFREVLPDVLMDEDGEFIWTSGPAVDFKAFEDIYGFGEETEELFSQLNETDKDILRLKFGAEYSNREIAQLLNMTEENVKKRYQRMKKRMAQILDEREVDAV